MNTYQTAGIVGAFALLAWQAYVSFLVIRSSAYSRSQKVKQALLIWLLPVVGVGLAHWFVGPGASALPEKDRDFLRQDIPAPGATRVDW